MTVSRRLGQLMISYLGNYIFVRIKYFNNQKSSVEEILTLYILGILRIDILVILKKIQVPTHSELELTTLNSAESVRRAPVDQITPAKKFLKSLKLRESTTLFRGLESKPQSGKEECVSQPHLYTTKSHIQSPWNRGLHKDNQ